MTSLLPLPILFHLGEVPITSHGLLFAVGAETAILCAYSLARKVGLPTERLSERFLIIFLAGLLAARVGFFISYPQQFQSLTQLLSIWQGGLVSYFGIAGGLFVAYRIYGRSLRWLDVAAVAGLVGWAVGRIGNFVAGDSVGVMSAHWSLTYGRVPIQLFESLLCLIVAAALWKRAPLRLPGQTLVLALIGYLGGRIVIDAWRSEAAWAGLHVSQWISLCLLLAAIPFLARRHAAS